ncbi:outer membrane protein [Levilactobacillus paucivorans]|uniref:Outer membrane protein n=2 Tax=Levilactobacillus paucivorans TaxID=616990 RepID=A0A0R2LSW1_9LACO|nr:outer membrane protein [Levilactobacillus paucivorans]
MGIVLGVILLLGMAVPAHAADITTSTKGLDTPASIEEETGSNTYTPVTDFDKLYTGQNYQLNYTWSIDNGVNVKDGDTAKVSVPTNASPSPAYFAVNADDANKTVVGDVTINPGEDFGTIKFNSKLEQSNVGRTGTLQFNAVGRVEKASTGGATFTINKNGWVNKNDYVNFLPTKVTWNIVFNPNNKDMGEVTLKDLIGPMQTYIDGSLGATDKDGNTVTPDITVSGSNLKMVFHNVTSEISMTYLTTVDVSQITGQTTGVFSNQVDLSSTSGDSGSASTGSGSDAGGPIEADSIKNAHWGGEAVLSSDYVAGFKLTKTAFGDTTALLPGATYRVDQLQSDGTTYKTVQSGLKTGDDGVLDDPLLKVGTYHIVETQAPDGYLLDQKAIPLTIAADDDPQIHELSQVDSPNAATLTKTDAVTGKVLPGAKYELKDDAGDVVGDPKVTDAEGHVVFTKLNPGKYSFVETEAPDGYEINNEPVSFTISNTDTEVVTKSQTDSPSSATLIKTDAMTGDALPGAKYELQDAAGKVIRDSVTTDADGKAVFTKLSPGKYFFHETAAPDGYELNTALVPVMVSDTGTDTDAAAATVSQKDSPNSAVLTKTDAVTGAVVKGATYDLEEKDGTVVREAADTDEKGQVAFNKLNPGTYYFAEKSSPAAYEVNEERVPVTISSTDTAAVNVAQKDQPVTSSSSSSSSSSSESSSTSSTSSSSESSSTSSISSSSDSSSTSSASSSSDSSSTSSSDSSHSSASSSISSSHSNHNSGSSSDATSSSSTSSNSGSSSSSSSTSTPSSKPNKVSSISSSSSSMTSGKIANGGVTSTSSSHGPKSGSSAKPGLQRYLPQTNEQKSLAAMIIGLAIFGISLSLWEWNRAWLRSLKH